MALIKGLFHKGGVMMGIATGRRAVTGPMFAVFCVTSACNLRCRFCHYHAPGLAVEGRPAGRPQHLDPRLFGAALADLRAMGTPEVVLLGEGEPLLYPHLPEVLRECARLGLRVSLVTNGTLLDAETAELLVRTGVERLKVSIAGASEKSCAAMRGERNSGDWEATRAGVRQALKARQHAGSNLPEITLHHILARPTLNEIVLAVQNAAELGTDGVSFAPLQDRCDGFSAIALEDAQSDQAKEALSRAAAQAESQGLRHNVPDVLLRLSVGRTLPSRWRCRIAWLSSRIQPDGKVHPCLATQFAAGNLHTQRFREIWYSEAYDEFRRQASRPGGVFSPRVQADCSYCCYVPIHDRIGRLFTPWRPRAQPAT